MARSARLSAPEPLWGEGALWPHLTPRRPGESKVIILVLGGVADESHRLAALLHEGDLLGEQPSEQDDPPIRGAEVLLAAIEEGASRLPGHLVLGVERGQVVLAVRRRSPSGPQLTTGGSSGCGRMRPSGSGKKVTDEGSWCACG